LDANELILEREKEKKMLEQHVKEHMKQREGMQALRLKYQNIEGTKNKVSHFLLLPTPPTP